MLNESKTNMINQSTIMNSYVDLYRQMRRYIWGFDVVDALADLEISSYKKCPNVDDIRSNYKSLYGMVRDVCDEDEELNEVFQEFGEIIDSCDTTYAKLDQVNEVVQ